MRPNSIKITPVNLGLSAIATFSPLTTACAPEPSPTVQSADHSQMGHALSMDLGPADANLDLRFIDAMKLHHQGAVNMAKEIQQKSKRPELQKLATAIIQAQDNEITQMKQWRKAWYPNANDTPMAYSAHMGHMMAMSPEQQQSMMMSQNLGTADPQLDLRFIDAMIPHHEGAITMATEAASKTKRLEIKQMAKAILTSQQAEVNQMKAWRKAWYDK